MSMVRGVGSELESSVRGLWSVMWGYEMAKETRVFRRTEHKKNKKRER